MLVIVALGDIDLTDFLHCGRAKNIRHHAGLHAPVGWETNGFGNATVQANLAADRIAKKLERPERLGEALDILHGLEKRSDEKPHDAAVQLRGKPGTEALADMECHLGMQHREAKADKQLAPVMKDIAVMDGNGGGICAGEDLPNAEPHIAPLPHRAGIKPCAFHLIKQVGHAGAVVPKNRELLRQVRKKAAGRVEIRFTASVEAHRNMA